MLKVKLLDMRLLLLLSLAMVLTLPLSAQDFRDCSSKAYSNLKLSETVTQIVSGKASIRLPQGWKVTREEETDGDLTIQAQATTSGFATIDITVGQQGKGMMDATAWQLEDADLFKESGAATDDNIITATKLRHHGLPALYVHYAFEQEGMGIEMQQMAILRDGMLYMLSFMTGERSAPCFYPLFNRVMESFVVE